MRPALSLDLVDNEWHGPDGWHARYVVNGREEVMIKCHDKTTLAHVMGQFRLMWLEAERLGYAMPTYETMMTEAGTHE